MGKAGGVGLLIAGLVVVFLGFVLRSGIFKWLIDATGFILIVVGIILVIIGIYQMVTGGSRGSSMDY